MPQFEINVLAEHPDKNIPFIVGQRQEGSRPKAKHHHSEADESFDES